ncbi:Immunity protein 8 [Actinopolyspora lacussalsi subsp. righensis]|uniref:Immunity protein 8 n=1 Tax=Actinopolyspora righensis TaxID=995060 RepID=A0A1I6X6K9_9ACTN|nr:Imm8 family immunity protein [Actinopolyspora righensis]SFT33732.1 Immunity protein 8 [Actinopolyspora righensis]
MRAVIKDYHSPDVDLCDFGPDYPEDFGFLLQMFVGPSEDSGEEAFDVLVCTPKWASRRVRETGPLVGRGVLLVENHSWYEIRGFLEKYVNALEAPTWDRLAEKIGRLGNWEFEGDPGQRSVACSADLQNMRKST